MYPKSTPGLSNPKPNLGARLWLPLRQPLAPHPSASSSSSWAPGHWLVQLNNCPLFSELGPFWAGSKAEPKEAMQGPGSFKNTQPFLGAPHLGTKADGQGDRNVSNHVEVGHSKLAIAPFCSEQIQNVAAIIDWSFGYKGPGRRPHLESQSQPISINTVYPIPCKEIKSGRKNVG